MQDKARESPSPIDPAQREFLGSVDRFISTLAGAFQSFHLYNHDNKIIDEILQNVGKRFALIQLPEGEGLRVSVSNRSFLYKGKVLGLQKVTAPLASELRFLGFKEAVFAPPLQTRNIFQFLNVLSSKDTDESKRGKLGPLMGEEEGKSISLIFIAAHSSLLRLSDEILAKQLAPLALAKEEGGSGFLEAISSFSSAQLPDFYSYLMAHMPLLPKGPQSVATTLVEATRDGHFPFDRFIKLFPLTNPVKAELQKISIHDVERPRKESSLGHRFRPLHPGKTSPHPRGNSSWVAFTSEEIEAIRAIRSSIAQLSPLQDLGVAESLMKEGSPRFSLGVRLLNRHLGKKAPIPVQEKALRLGIRVWDKMQTEEENVTLTPLLASMREKLSRPANISLLLTPVRRQTIDSEEFQKVSKMIFSLGETAIPPLLQLLEAEEDRGMRKKICQMITTITAEQGTDTLLKATSNAGTFLLRNILMILGDLRLDNSIDVIFEQVHHPHKIVRTEALKSLCKIGSKRSKDHLMRALELLTDAGDKKPILDYFVALKDRQYLPSLIRMAQEASFTFQTQKNLYTAIGQLGGHEARAFLQSKVKTGFSFDREKREEQNLIQSLLDRMAS